MQPAGDALRFDGVEVAADEPPRVVVVVDPLPRRLRVAEADVVRLVESGERLQRGAVT